MGHTHLQAGQYGKSINYYKEAAKLASELGCETRAVDANIRLGSALSYSGDFESAEKYLLEAIRLAKSLNNQCLEKEAQTHLGHVYYKCGKLDAAVKSYLEALKLPQDLGDRKHSSTLANSLEQMKQFENVKMREETESGNYYTCITLICANKTLIFGEAFLPWITGLD